MYFDFRSFWHMRPHIHGEIRHGQFPPRKLRNAEQSKLTWDLDDHDLYLCVYLLIFLMAWNSEKGYGFRSMNSQKSQPQHPGEHLNPNRPWQPYSTATATRWDNPDLPAQAKIIISPRACWTAGKRSTAHGAPAPRSPVETSVMGRRQLASRASKDFPRWIAGSLFSIPCNTMQYDNMLPHPTLCCTTVYHAVQSILVLKHVKARAAGWADSYPNAYVSSFLLGSKMVFPFRRLAFEMVFSKSTSFPLQ